MRTSLVAAIFAVLGCGGSSGLNNNNNNGRACTAAVSGAISGTATCTAFIGSFDSRSNASGVAATFDGSAYVNVNLNFSGDLQPGTYTNASVGGGSAVTAQQSSGSRAVWAAQAGSLTTQGSWTFVLTDVGQSSSGSGVKGYPAVHGTLDATLPAEPGSSATGTATLHATF